MISNCPECRYYHRKGCAIQPTYWEMRISICRYSSALLQQVLPWLQDCPDWELQDPLPLNTFPQTIKISGVEFDL